MTIRVAEERQHAIKRLLVIVDDIVTAGTAVREVADLIRRYDGELVGVVVALDRWELADGDRTAVESLAGVLGVPVISIANLADVIGYLETDGRYAEARLQLTGYQKEHCRVAQG